MATMSRSNGIVRWRENWSDSDSYSSGSDGEFVHNGSSSATMAYNLNNETISLANNSTLLNKYSGRISGMWKQVGRNLHVKECIIENIGEDFRCDGTREMAYQLLLFWSRSLGSNATEEDLLNAISVSKSQKVCIVRFCVPFYFKWGL